MRIVVIGAGGHGREVAEILQHQSQSEGGIEVMGFVDERRDLHGTTRDNLPVLGDWTWFDGVDRSDVHVICAVASPTSCCRLVCRARQLGLRFIGARSPLAWVSPLARIDEGVIIFPNVVVTTQAHLRDHCTVNVGATISHDTVVGRYSFIGPGAHLAGNVAVSEGCWISTGVDVIPGCSIGAWTTVGAGAVVLDNVPGDATAAGVPARVVKYERSSILQPDE